MQVANKQVWPLGTITLIGVVAEYVARRFIEIWTIFGPSSVAPSQASPPSATRSYCVYVIAVAPRRLMTPSALTAFATNVEQSAKNILGQPKLTAISYCARRRGDILCDGTGIGLSGIADSRCGGVTIILMASRRRLYSPGSEMSFALKDLVGTLRIDIALSS